MQTVKTAISIDKALFEQADELARRFNLSRSKLVAIALEEYLMKRQNQELIERINAAVADEPDPAEQRLSSSRRRTHRRLVEGTW